MDGLVRIVHVYTAFDWPSLCLSPPRVRPPQPW